MRRCFLAAISIGLICSVALAQGREENAQAMQKSATGNAESRRLLEEVLMARLTKELALDESQTVLLMRHMTEFRDRMMALRRERAEKMRALRQAVRESRSEEQINSLMKEVLETNRKSAIARDEIIEFDGFELTTWQKARLLVFLNDFEGDMKRLLKRARERRSANAPENGEVRSRRSKQTGESSAEMLDDGNNTKEEAPEDHDSPPGS